MRFFEIARIPNLDFGKEGTVTPPDFKVKKKPLPGGSGFNYAVKKTSDNVSIMIFDGEEIAAELNLFATQDPLKTWRVETIAVEPKFRGHGLAKALYGVALSILKLTVEAGDTQTRHGQRMWLMLNSIPGVDVKGYNMVATNKYQPHPKDEIVDQNKQWTRYLFPVTPGKHSMRSQRAGVGLYTTMASMVARWTGK
jgi:GNAT superfamily N-acetyltransferase